MKRFFLFLIVFLILLPVVFSKEIKFKLNQSEYYFLVGEEAIIPLEIENSYGKDIHGILSYTITQEIIQQGFQYSSSNTQSTSFSIEKGDTEQFLNFGTSNQQSSLKVSLNFQYNEKGEKSVLLDDIIIHFVSNENQKQNNNQEKQSSSGESEQQQQQQQSMMEQMEQRLQEMFQNNQQQTPSSQQRVQNNQMAQDTSALKQQMQKQLQEQKKLQEEFGKNLEQNQQLQNAHQGLMEQGFKQSGGSVNPTNSTSGEFELEYEKNGETVKLEGKMENNEMKEIKKTSSEDGNRIMEKLRQDERFQNFDSELANENFTQLDPEFNKEGNITNIKVPYINENNETAHINAMFENNEIKDVKLDRDSKYNWIFIGLVILFTLLIIFIVYYKFFRNIKEEKDIKKEKPIDYRKEALKILKKSEELFQKRKEKDAYGKAAEAIRYYYSYKFGLRKELTNYELIKELKRNKIVLKDTRSCLNLCGLVEFAKYKTNIKDFEKIIDYTKKIIK